MRDLKFHKKGTLRDLFATDKGTQDHRICAEIFLNMESSGGLAALFHILEDIDKEVKAHLKQSDKQTDIYT